MLITVMSFGLFAQAQAGEVNVRIDHLIPGAPARVALYLQSQSNDVNQKPLAAQEFVPFNTEAAVSFPMLEPGLYRLTAYQAPDEHMGVAAISMSIDREGQIRNLEVGNESKAAKLHMFTVGGY